MSCALRNVARLQLAANSATTGRVASTSLVRSSGRLSSSSHGLSNSLLFADKERENPKQSPSYLMQSQRSFHLTSRKENTPLVIGTSIAVIAYSGKLVIEAFDRRQAAKAAAEAAAKEQGPAGDANVKEDPLLLRFLNYFLGKTFYEGGFEE